MEENAALSGDGSSAEILALALSWSTPALPQGIHSDLDGFVGKVILCFVSCRWHAMHLRLSGSYIRPLSVSRITGLIYLANKPI